MLIMPGCVCFDYFDKQMKHHRIDAWQHFWVATSQTNKWYIDHVNSRTHKMRNRRNKPLVCFHLHRLVYAGIALLDICNQARCVQEA